MPFRGAQEIGPHFALGQHHDIRADAAQGALHRPGEIQRPEEHRQIGEALRRLDEPGVGGGGDDALPVGVALAERGDDVLEQVDFADADAVEPDAADVPGAQKSAAGELTPQATFADQPGETKNQGDAVDEV